MISGNYLNQDGVIKNSGFNRFTLRTNLNRNVRKWLKVGMNVNFNRSNTNIAKTTTSSGSGVLRSALIFPVTYDPNIENEQLSDELSWLSGNPHTFVKNAKDDLISTNINTSSNIEIIFHKSLRFKQRIGINFASKQRGTYYDRSTREGMYVNGLAGQSDNYRISYVSESLLTWNKSYNRNKHRFNVVGGFTAEIAQYGSKSMSASQFPTDRTGYYDMGAGLDPKALVSAYGANALVSFLLRGNYTLYNKYIFTGTFRTDGSSKFVEGNKFAPFYSGAFAWRLSEEKFIKQLDFFSNLKLRASYGETGNQGINSYETFTQLGVNNYPFGGGGLSSGGAVYGDITSSDLRWETTRQYDFGADFGFANNLVTFTADYYHKNTYDLLQTVIIPSSAGYKTMLVNSGNVTNSGFEFSVGLNDVFRGSDWRWDINANISFNQNQISGLEADQFAPRLFYGVENVYIQRNGLPIGTIYGYVEDGFYDNISEVKADPQYSGLSDAEALKKVGEVKYLDVDGEEGLTTSDMTVIGNVNPDFTYGMSTMLSWKGITLNLFFQGSQGNDIFNANLIDQDMGKTKNISQAAYDTRWTPENAAIAKWPKPTQEYTRKMLISDRYVEDGSYLKLKNINLEYRYPLKIQTVVSAITVYANASNVFTLTNYSGYDPEVNSFGNDASRKGVDYYAYPSNRTYTLGLKVNF